LEGILSLHLRVVVGAVVWVEVVGLIREVVGLVGEVVGLAGKVVGLVEGLGLVGVGGKLGVLEGLVEPVVGGLGGLRARGGVGAVALWWKGGELVVRPRQVGLV